MLYYSRQLVQALTNTRHTSNAVAILMNYLGISVKQFRVDYPLLLFVVCVSLFGWIMVTTSSMTSGLNIHGSAYYFSIRQLVHIVIMLSLLVLVASIPVSLIKQSVPWLLLMSVVLLLMLHVPNLGREINGSTRWLHLFGVSFEVSEIVKWVVILYFSLLLDKQKHSYSHMSWVKMLVVFSIVALLLLKQPDFGSIVVMTSILLMMAFLYGVPLIFFAMISLSASWVLWFLVQQKSYRVARLMSFQNPWSDPLGHGYQLVQSLIAIGSGGIWGVGIGNSMQKWSYLPESHTDFIFSIIIEELGAIMGSVLIASYAAIILYLLRQGYRHHATFEQQVYYGVASWLCVQTAIAFSVPMGLLPTKGLTLPLISYGGSSLVVFGLAFGLLFRIHHESVTGDVNEAT